MNANYISSADLQNIYCNDLDFTNPVYPDATISGMISAASRRVDGFTNAWKGWDFEVVATETIDSTVGVHTDADGNLVIPLAKRPLAPLIVGGDPRSSVTGITIRLGTYNTSLSLTSGGNYIFHNPDPGWYIMYPNSYLISIGTLLGQTKLGSLRSYRYEIDMAYAGGYVTIPEDIRYATSLYFRSIYAKKYNPADGFDTRVGGEQVGHSLRGQKEVSVFAIEAEEVLQRYLRVF